MCFLQKIHGEEHERKIDKYKRNKTSGGNNMAMTIPTLVFAFNVNQLFGVMQNFNTVFNLQF